MDRPFRKLGPSAFPAPHTRAALLQALERTDLASRLGIAPSLSPARLAS